jgi:hypothetical protein
MLTHRPSQPLARSRTGASTLGCLFTLLIAAVVVYFGVNIAEVYWREYEFQDTMRQQVTFAGHMTNDAILVRLRAQADSLGLPDDASAITITRTPTNISIDSFYDDRVELPMTVRIVHFHPHAEGPY